MTYTSRVVVTGIGAVTPLGHSLVATCDALERRTCAFAPPTFFDSSGYAERLSAEVRDFDATPYFRVRKAMKVAHRATRFAVSAASMALADAAWPDDRSRENLGVIIGSSGSDPQVGDIARALAPDPEARSATDIRYFSERILEGLNPLWLLVGLPNMASSHVAIQLEAQGPNSTVMTDWIAGSQAIGEAMLWIQGGEATAVLAGGADTALFPHAYASYDQAGVLGGGFIPGEGAAVLLLEHRDHALARGARIKGEICGYATSAGPKALARTMKGALSAANSMPSDVRVVGMASVPAERFMQAEEEAIGEVLGSRATQVPRVEFRSRIGHALAAASAIDIALLLQLHGHSNGGTMVCNSLGYTGQAATLALRRPV